MLEGGYTRLGEAGPSATAAIDAVVAATVVVGTVVAGAGFVTVAGAAGSVVWPVLA